MRKYAREGERPPKWYGVSFYNFSRKEFVCHPIPLNWIVRAWRNVKFYLKKPPFKDKITNLQWDAYWEGVDRRGPGVILCDELEKERQSKRGTI